MMTPRTDHPHRRVREAPGRGPGHDLARAAGKANGNFTDYLGRVRAKTGKSN
jgi:hypothetical protein